MRDVTMSVKFKPTDEQLLILDAFNKHKVIKVNAIAGSGKSSTLKLLAEANVVPSLYLCFNRKNADEAKEKFPSHTKCSTIHSLAYGVFGKHLQHKMNFKDYSYINRARTAKEIADFFSIQDVILGTQKISAGFISACVKRTVEVYQNKDDVYIKPKHTPIIEIYNTLDSLGCGDHVNAIQDIVVTYADKLWKEKIDVKSVVKADHDTYQKLYQLSKPKLPYDVVYLDEAQDSSPVVLDILKQQDCKVVYVGDSYQSIYAFRQAVNAMECVEAPTYLLSKSFRYGEEIAKVASSIINNEIEVKGCEGIDSVVSSSKDSYDKQYTKIFRTNGALLSEAVELLSQGKKVKCDIDPYKFKSMIESVQALKDNDLSGAKDDDIAMYQSWEDIVEDDNAEIKRLVRIVESYQTHKYVRALNDLIQQQKGKKVFKWDVLLTTAHKSKGMEWDNVVIASDFDLDLIFSDERLQQEVNLFYVACTRAIKELYLDFTALSLLLANEHNKQKVGM